MSSSIPASTPGKPWQPLTPAELQPELPQQSSDAVLPQPGMKAAQTVVASQPGINAAQSAAGPQSRPMPRPVGGPRQSYAPPPKSKAPLFLGIVAMAVIAAGASALPPELAALDTQFIKLQTERVTAPFDADLAKLNAGYLGGIAKKIAEEKAAGHLDGILAFEAEQKLITDKQPLPDTDEEKTPATLTALRGIYRTAYAKLAATRATNLKALIAPLDARLATMESDFSKSDRLADAKTVRGYREVLKESTPEVPSGATQQLASATATPGAATPPQTGLKPTTSLAPAAMLAAKDGITNSLGMKFVPVKGTDVLFCIHEVRYQDYAAYAAEAQGVDGTWKDQNADGYALTENKENHPVMKVSWEDAQKFCAWLSKKEGKFYRLPTDQEWSIAVGIGRDEKWKEDTTPATVFQNTTDFPWGDKWPPPKDSGNFNDESRKAKAPNGIAQYLDGYDDGFPTTAPVMSFKPNKLGLYDLGGNVWEWVEDWWDNAKAERVLRGGSWNSYVRGLLLSSGRGRDLPGGRVSMYGFRVVLVVSGG